MLLGKTLMGVANLANVARKMLMGVENLANVAWKNADGG